MTRWVPTLLLGLVALLSPLSAQAVAPSTAITVTNTFESPSLLVIDASTRVKVEGCETLHRVGAPLLPFRTVRLLLPPGGRVAKIDTRPLQGPMVIANVDPVEHGRMPRTPGPGTFANAGQLADAPDSAIYSSPNPYPSTWAELASVQRMGGFDVAFIRVFPVQYLPAKRELQHVTRLEIQVTLDPIPAASPTLTPSVRQHRRVREELSGWVDNPAMLQSYETEPHEVSAASTFDYLLITRNALADSFQPLVALKQQNGLSVKVETVETITNTYSGIDVQQKIRNYIRYAYTNWGIRYVLLGGDATTVPHRSAYISGVGQSPILPTDLYYACLDGSWNGDGDARWGESTDGDGGGDVDLLAEVYVGRAPVDTVTEVNVFVEKTVRYATQPHPQLTNLLFLAEVLTDLGGGVYAQGGDLLDPVAPLFGTSQIHWLDDRITMPAWTRTDAIGAQSQSPHLVLFAGHSDWLFQTLFGWGNPIQRSIEIPDLDGLTNQFPFLAYSVGCDVGRFDDFSDSIGEELLKRHSRGAFAAVFNTREGLYDPSNEPRFSGEFQFKFFTNLVALGRTNLAVANQFSKHDMLGHVEASGIMGYRWCYYQTTLFGDPQVGWQTLDADRDGLHDWQENIAGTSPTDPASVLLLRTVPSATSGVARLEWPSVGGRVYSVLRASAPSPGGFTLLSNNVVATPPTNIFLDNGAGTGPRFYRVEVRTSP